MPSPRKPWWQQATAMVSLGTGGAITGFAFVHGAAAQVASPASVPVTLTALDQVAQPPAAQAVPDESVVRSAIVKVARYYARLAQTKTPAQMEALIWQQDSPDGADHGQSCAAFASMTLQLGAQLAGRQSWVTGGSTYPWPLHDWVDARVDPNAASLNITSVLQDAQAHERWHALGDGYQPQPGDWVLFSGHVEVVTGYADGVLSTIGGDSLPDFSVNAHEYSGSLSSHGVEGFVDNGNLPTATATATGRAKSASPAAQQQTSGPAAQQRTSAAATSQADRQAEDSLAAIPGTAITQGAKATQGAASAAAAAAIPGMPSASAQPRSTGQNSAGQGSARQASARQGSAGSGDAQAADQPDSQPTAAIPGLPSSRVQTTPAATPSAEKAASPAPSYQRHQPSASSSAATPGTAAQRAFINEIAPGALAAQRTYGVPAAVTIAQAIDESAWGQSTLASQDHNLFGIKGTGPAGSVMLPTQEVYGGQTVSTTAQFRMYHNVAESIDDHGRLLAQSGSYAKAMASQDSPNAFANALTGVYATDPSYGTSLIGLMRQYNLYRYDASATSSAAPSASASPKSQPHGATQSHPASRAPGTTRPAAKATSPSLAAPSISPSPRVSAASPAPAPAPATSSGRTASPAPTMSSPAASSPAASSPAASSPAAGGRTATTAPRSASVPHPFATPASSAPSTTNSAPPASPGHSSAAGSTGADTGGSGGGRALGQAEIPGILGTAASSSAASNSPAAAGSGSTSGSQTPDSPAASSGHSSAGSRAEASTSAAVQSPATPVDAELTAVYRPAAAPEPATAASYRSASGTVSASAEHTAASRTNGRPAHAGQDLAAAARTGQPAAAKKAAKRKAPGPKARRAATRYQPEMPPAVKNALLSSARKPLARAELVYRDVASSVGVSWKILAACDWMQCDAHPRYSPVRGEKLGTVNPDGTVFHTKSEALAQCARDLVTLAGAVYEIDLGVPVPLTVLELANVFAAYRWGGLLRQHNTSAMEFPYSVQGLTDQFTHMRWPKIADPNAPDKPGSRFRRAFGAVPVVLSLDYPAIVL